MAGQFFDGGMNGAFGQSNGKLNWLYILRSQNYCTVVKLLNCLGFDGIFSGTGSPSSFDGGSFFGGPPATPQQQQTGSGGKEYTR